MKSDMSDHFSRLFASRAILSEASEVIPPSSAGGILFVVDHASGHVPDDVDLGVDSSVLSRHVAVDIGVDMLTRRLMGLLSVESADATPLDTGAVFARVSRLVIDLNRDPASSGLIPVRSDDVDIPGNAILTNAAKAQRIARFHAAYHQAVAGAVEGCSPALLVAVHSFTPQLSSRPEESRPWDVGILYNQDDRAARIALELLEREGCKVGDNLPYSGKLLNYTMDRHAEAHGLPYLSLEIRQDLIGSPVGVTHWSEKLAPVIKAVHAGVRA